MAPRRKGVKRWNMPFFAMVLLWQKGWGCQQSRQLGVQLEPGRIGTYICKSCTHAGHIKCWKSFKNVVAYASGTQYIVHHTLIEIRTAVRPEQREAEPSCKHGERHYPNTSLQLHVLSPFLDGFLRMENDINPQTLLK